MAVYQTRKMDDLTPEQVVALRALRGTMTARDAGMIYNRSADTVRRIWRGESYREGYVPLDVRSEQRLQEQVAGAPARILEGLDEMIAAQAEKDKRALEDWWKMSDYLRKMRRAAGLAPKGDDPSRDA